MILLISGTEWAETKNYVSSPLKLRKFRSYDVLWVSLSCQEFLRFCRVLLGFSSDVLQDSNKFLRMDVIGSPTIVVGMWKSF
jgi:hypothetical protein